MEFSLSTIVAIISVSFIIGAVVGWFAHTRAVLAAMLDDPDYTIAMLNKYKNELTVVEIDSDVCEMEVEVDQGVFYLYEKENKRFLAQGSTLELALDEVGKRFPNQKFQGNISPEDAKRFGLV